MKGSIGRILLTVLVFVMLIAFNASAATNISIDGSSTVYPITEAVAEEFQKESRDVRVTVGISGTGGGFKKFCRGEIDISDASRPIKQSEIDLCRENGIEYIELPVAYDGLAVVVNKNNTWLKSIKVSELKAMWSPDSQGKVNNWNQINPSWPNEEFKLFGPGTDSGTYDYFTEAINGKAGASRGDYTSSEDDNVVVYGVSSDDNAIAYFGMAYYEENMDKLNVVLVDGQKGRGAIEPTRETVNNGSYQPLSRPLFIYVSKKALDRPEVKQFTDYYLENAALYSEEVGYVALPDDVFSLVQSRYSMGKSGSVFEGAGAIGVSLSNVLTKR